ncbi:Spore [Nucleospora cyclopteri]
MLIIPHILQVSALDVLRNIKNSNKEIEFKIKILTPRIYAAKYEKTHESFGADLQKITSEVESQLNSSVKFKNNGLTTKFHLEHSQNHPVIDQLDESLCEGSMLSITNLLNDINNVDAASHYVVMLPCSPTNYSDIFNSIHIDVPLIQQHINTECSNRIAIFQETKYTHLMASFGNALIKAIGGPVNNYTKLDVTHRGDEGLKVTMTISDDTVHHILNSKCIYNILTS